MIKALRNYFKMRDHMDILGMCPQASERNTSPTNKCGKRRVEILDAVNGHVLEIAHRKTPQHDWEVTLYMVRDNESLADAIATALVVTGGE
jgi:hypothetical protein